MVSRKNALAVVQCLNLQYYVCIKTLREATKKFVRNRSSSDLISICTFMVGIWKHDAVKDAVTDGRTDGRTNGWMRGWMEGCMDGGLDGWMDSYMFLDTCKEQMVLVGGDKGNFFAFYMQFKFFIGDTVLFMQFEMSGINFYSFGVVLFLERLLHVLVAFIRSRIFQSNLINDYNCTWIMDMNHTMGVKIVAIYVPM